MPIVHVAALQCTTTNQLCMYHSKNKLDYISKVVQLLENAGAGTIYTERTSEATNCNSISPAAVHVFWYW